MSDRYGPSEAWYRDYFHGEGAWTIVDQLVGNGLGHRPDSMTTFREYHTVAGPIDLLIAFSRALIVVEFKRDVADESAVAQVLRYQGALVAALVTVPIFAVVIAPAFTEKALFAASVSDVSMLAARPHILLEQTFNEIPPLGLYMDLREIVNVPKSALPAFREELVAPDHAGEMSEA